MSAELFFARSWSVIAAILVLVITGGGFAVFLEYFKRWKREKDDSFNTQAWTALVVTTILDVLLFAVLDVGQAFALVSEGWGAIVGICSVLLMPILGYKSVQSMTANKETKTTSISGAETIRSETKTGDAP